ncbi:hypothetical protein N0A02_26380 [Paraburkholderia acidicola]|uniref:SMODS and SLOG-associating 2TM effector domain-containing protein n=1 Tax=Paraburkholderia acidicola TaxID=1912599 RepID=A0ABV1LUI3_9BURK
MEAPDTRIAERIILCKRERRAYEIWLRTLTPANFMLVGVGGLLSLVAGLSIVTKAELIPTHIAGWIAVVGALLTGLHNRLKCDPHQKECTKLANQFSELQTEYERLQVEPDMSAKERQLQALEHRLATIRGGRGARASQSSIERAEREIDAAGEAI